MVREKAGAEFRNRIKYGAKEGFMAIGGGFPLIGKATQLGYKYGLNHLWLIDLVPRCSTVRCKRN